MIKSYDDSVLLQDEALGLIDESKRIVNELYCKLKEFDEKMANDYIDDLSSMLKELLDGKIAGVQNADH